MGQTHPIPGLTYISNEQQAYSLLHRSVGALSWKDKYKAQRIGTGILISKNLVLTSAQNIYNKAYHSQNRKFKFHLGPHTYQIQDWKYPYAFTTTDQSEKASSFDYAIGKLKENKQNPITFDSFLELTPPCQICLLDIKDLKLELYGFPQYDETNKKVDQLRQFGVTKKGAIKKVQLEKCKLQYEIPTYPGQQGAPVIANSKIIAIHNRISSINPNHGLGRMITSEMIVAISNWSEQLGGSQFKVCNNNLCDYLKKSYEMTIENRWKSFVLGFKNHHQQKLNIQIGNNYDEILRLQIIDLTSRDNCKLTQDSIVAFSKLKLNNLSQLKLDNNRIEDKGLEILCQKDYPSLKVIQLDDNAVTINGLKYILLNQWSTDVEYKLYSVYSKDDGYLLKVDQNIPLIKSIIKNDSQNLDEMLANQGERKVFNAIKLLLITPLEGQSDENVILQSKEIENKLKKEKKKDGIALADLLLLLKKGYGDSLNLVKQANLKTQLTSKIIFNGAQNQRINLAIKLDKFKQFKPQEFKDNHQKLKEFQRQFLMYLKMSYGVDTTDVTIDKITSKPFVVELSDSYKQIIKNQPFYAKIQIQVKKYFENFQLSQEQFDEEGNSQFPEPSRAQVQERGGFPYYRSVVGTRFGIKVKNLYGSNNWLANNRNKEEWAIAFHGVKFPTKRNTLAEMMKGRAKGEMLNTDGQRQSYQNYDCINKSEKVGKGVYFSPYFLSCLFNYSDISGNQEYHLVLQCRVKPEAIKITPKPEYWVINKSEDARPYGILLFKREQKAQLEKILHSKDPIELHRYLYKDEFTKDTWENKYREKFLQFTSK